MNLRITCGCGTAGTVRITDLDEAWRCPHCGAVWAADEAAKARFTEFAGRLRRVRLTVVISLLVAAIATVVLAFVYPAWLLMAPLLAGVAGFLWAPRYRRRLTLLYRDRPQAMARPGS